MKKALTGIFIAFIVMVVGTYICVLAMFQGPIVADLSECVQYNFEQKMIILPWYLELSSKEFAQWDGTDDTGKSYTWFSYELPAIWEDAEMNCIVSWNDESTKLYVGEPRAMFCINVDFDRVEWRFQ